MDVIECWERALSRKTFYRTPRGHERRREDTRHANNNIKIKLVSRIKIYRSLEKHMHYSVVSNGVQRSGTPLPLGPYKTIYWE